MLQELANRIDRISGSFSGAAGDVMALTEAHVELLEEELRVNKLRSLHGFSYVLLALALGGCGLILASMGLVTYLVDVWGPSHTSNIYLAVGAFWIVTAAVIAWFGYFKLSQASPIPHATWQSLKESLKCLTIH